VSEWIGDHRKRLSFTPGSGGGWYSDHRQHRRTCFSNTSIVLHLPTIGEQEIGTLAAVNAAAPSETNDEVHVVWFGKLNATFHIFRGGIRGDTVKNEYLSPGGSQHSCGAVTVTGFFQPGVGHEQQTRPAQFLDKIAESRKGTLSEDQSGPGLILKGG
jgi:hypothetical protein